MDLGLTQREVARRIGADVWTIHNWECNRTEPAPWWMPRITEFLGYALYAPARSPAERFEAARRAMGVSKAKVARVMGVDPETLTRWLRGEGRPPGDLWEGLRRLFRRP